LEAAVELAARFVRVIIGADALHLGAPVFLVLREAVLAGVRADELAARALLVLLDLPVDLRLQPHRGEAQVGEVAPVGLCLRFLGARLARRGRGPPRLRLPSLRKQLFLAGLEAALAPLR